MLFRNARPEDAKDLEVLINSAYRGDSARQGWTHEAELVDGQRITIQELSEILASKNQYYIIALSREGLSGCVHLTESGEFMDIGMLTVRPDLQGQKIGAALFDEIERLARKGNFKALRLSVIHPRKELIAYYERKGFLLTGESEPFPEKYPAKIPGLRLLEMKKTL